MSASQLLKSKQRERDAPPTLFQNPPSHNASRVSLPTISINAVPSVSQPQRPPLIQTHSNRISTRTTLDAAPDGGDLARAALPYQSQAYDGKRQADRIEAVWAGMQTTLEEVELSAVNEARVFRPEHSKALEDLRAAQIALAQAWARGEAEDHVDPEAEHKAKATTLLGSEGKVETEGAKSTAASSTGIDEKSGSKLEEETEVHILLARQRREANDRYFRRVNAGVLDVVAKLEDVAIAMRTVEQETRDIWGENESILSTDLSAPGIS